MAEIITMKTLKLLISLYCWFGTGVVAIDQFTEADIRSMVSPAAQHIILYLLIVFWVIKIAWFAYDKFYLERGERILKMKKERQKLKKESD